MKRQFLFVFWSVVSVLVAVAGMTAIYWTQRTVWPDFPPASDPAPQVLVQVEPDFAWRIGDRVPVTIFVREAPGVEVDLNSLATEGDFEIAGNIEVVEREKRDGSRLVRITVYLQSFKAAEKLSFKALLGYTVGGSRDVRTLTIGAPDLYTSRTWDGRPDIKDGPLPVQHGWHYVVSAVALLVGFAGSIGALILLARYRRQAASQIESIPLSRWQQARADFNQVWAQIAMGDESEERFKEIERIIRRLYHIESRTLREIPFEIGHNHPHLKGIKLILGGCGLVLYGHQKLTPEQKAAMRAAFDAMIPPARKAPAAAGKK